MLLVANSCLHSPKTVAFLVNSDRNERQLVKAVPWELVHRLRNWGTEVQKGCGRIDYSKRVRAGREGRGVTLRSFFFNNQLLSNNNLIGQSKSDVSMLLVLNSV